MDKRDWIMAETENGMLTEKHKMKSRVVEKCEKIQRERPEIAKTLSHGCSENRSVGRSTKRV